MSKKSGLFRIGKVVGYLRGHVWYLCYHENGQRHRLTAAAAVDTHASRRLDAGREIIDTPESVPVTVLLRPVAGRGQPRFLPIAHREPLRWRRSLGFAF